MTESADFDKTARWQRLRRLRLTQHPLHKFCLERGIVTAASVIDHVVPHRGDWTAFVTGRLQSADVGSWTANRKCCARSEHYRFWLGSKARYFGCMRRPNDQLPGIDAWIS